jgi:hypothetical protein
MKANMSVTDAEISPIYHLPSPFNSFSGNDTSSSTLAHSQAHCPKQMPPRLQTHLQGLAPGSPVNGLPPLRAVQCVAGQQTSQLRLPSMLQHGFTQQQANQSQQNQRNQQHQQHQQHLEVNQLQSPFSPSLDPEHLALTDCTGCSYHHSKCSEPDDWAANWVPVADSEKVNDARQFVLAEYTALKGQCQDLREENLRYKDTQEELTQNIIALRKERDVLRASCYSIEEAFSGIVEACQRTKQRLEMGLDDLDKPPLNPVEGLPPQPRRGKLMIDVSMYGLQ